MKNKIFSVVLITFLSPTSQALTAEASTILNKRNRVLDAPPRALTSSTPSTDYRYAQAVERAQASNAALEEAPVTTVYTEPRATAVVKDERGLGQFLGDRNLGVGFIGAGAYGIFGAEIDLKVDNNWTAGLGVGTGMTYRTWGVHTRYLFRPSQLTGFIEAGYTNWYVYKTSKTGGQVYPQHMAERFFQEKNGGLSEGKRAHLLYPGFGMLYKHKSGMGAIAQIQYFINTSGGLQGALGASAGLYMFF